MPLFNDNGNWVKIRKSGYGKKMNEQFPLFCVRLISVIKLPIWYLQAHAWISVNFTQIKGYYSMN